MKGPQNFGPGTAAPLAPFQGLCHLLRMVMHNQLMPKVGGGAFDDVSSMLVIVEDMVEEETMQKYFVPMP